MSWLGLMRPILNIEETQSNNIKGCVILPALGRGVSHGCLLDACPGYCLLDMLCYSAAGLLRFRIGGVMSCVFGLLMASWCFLCLDEQPDISLPTYCWLSWCSLPTYLVRSQRLRQHAFCRNPVSDHGYDTRLCRNLWWPNPTESIMKYVFTPNQYCQHQESSRIKYCMYYISYNSYNML